jgi:hypothetical protein
MGTVTVSVNGKPYIVGCEDGQEGHVESLARQFDEQVREVGAQVGQVGELRLFLMAALLSADEIADRRRGWLLPRSNSTATPWPRPRPPRPLTPWPPASRPWWKRWGDEPVSSPLGR